MNDLTRPSAILGYANTVGLAVATVYLNSKTTALNAKYNDLAEDVDTIRDGIKEKVPMIENTIKGLDQNLRNVATVVNNNLGPMVKRTEKTDKKVAKYKVAIEELYEVIDIMDARYNALVKVLVDNKILENFKIEELVPLPTPPPIIKPKKIQKKKRVIDSSDESDSESESSEEEKPRKSKTKSRKTKKSRAVDEDEDSDTNIVARMASKR
jgi:hypothetical protein